MTGKRSEATLSPLQRIAVISDVVVPAGIEPAGSLRCIDGYTAKLRFCPAVICHPIRNFE